MPHLAFNSQGGRMPAREKSPKYFIVKVLRVS